MVSGEEGVIKPDPRIFRILLERYGIVPEEAVFMDDNPGNAAAATALAIHRIHCRSPEVLRRELESLGTAEPRRGGADHWNKARAAQQRGDYATALALYHALAEQGDALAQDSLGVLYEHGLGTRKSHAEAIKWYRRAAAQGDREAQNNLGVMHEHGHGVPRDPAAAVQWYRMAAAQGDTNAQHNLGNAYQSGLGVAQDHAEAVAWYRKAADAGHPMAQANLGVMYEHGDGVRQDFVQAHKWSLLSAMTFPASEAKSRGLVLRNRDQLAAQMTAADIAEARRLARDGGRSDGAPSLQSPVPAPTTASAVRLTSRRTVAEGVEIRTVFCAPSRIGPMVTPSPPVTFSMLKEMFAASRFGITSKFAPPFSVESGWTWLRMTSDSAASPCISPSTSRFGTRSTSRRRTSRILRADFESSLPKLECDSNATFGSRPNRRTASAASRAMPASCLAEGSG